VIEQHDYIDCIGCGRMFHPIAERRLFERHDCNNENGEMWLTTWAEKITETNEPKN